MTGSAYGILKKELNFLQENLLHYLNYWPRNPNWTPPYASRPFLELANHLYTLPAAYGDLLRGSPNGDLMRLWGGPWDGKSPEDLKSVLLEGTAVLILEADRLMAEDNQAPVPWPFGDPLTPQEHLMNLITHMYHHRGQLHLYLKQMGAKVDTGTLYTVSDGKYRTT